MPFYDDDPLLLFTGSSTSAGTAGVKKQLREETVKANSFNSLQGIDVKDIPLLFGGALYIRHFIRSVETLLFPPFKLLIIDDEVATVNVPDKTIERFATTYKFFRSAVNAAKLIVIFKSFRLPDQSKN